MSRSEGHLPGFGGATGWLNSGPLDPAELLGHVVLVQFWTYTCINWLRTLPYVRAWAGRYADDGLVVIGVHTPEFEFEHDIDDVRREVSRREIHYPVATDNDYAVWQAFGNHYWPALYFADEEGVIRDHHFGEGRYEQSERSIQRLLGVDRDLVSVEGRGDEAPADWDDVRSTETYLGNERGTRAATLSGDWTIREEPAVLNAPGGTIAYRFHARDLNLVMGAGTPVRFLVRIDGESPGASHGVDVDEHGDGTVSERRLYQLVRQPGRIEDHTFEIEFLDPGVEAYVFTFG